MIWAEMTNQQRSEAVMARLLDGRSAMDIALDLGAKSRNVIIGHIDRHIPKDRRPKRTRAFNRPPKPAREPRPPRERKARPAPRKEISLIPVDATPIGKYDAAFRALPGTSPVTLVNLENGQCRWPVDIDGKTLFCGCGVVENKNYCAIHNEMGRAKPEEA